MLPYKLYFVATAKVRPGKAEAAKKWWHEKGKAMYESIPGVKSVRAYVAQFSLGGEFGLEIWFEEDSYGALDRVDEDIMANPQKYAPLLETNDLWESGPSRLMGDWPESQLLPDA